MPVILDVVVDRSPPATNRGWHLRHYSRLFTQNNMCMVTSPGSWNRYLDVDPSMRVVNSQCHTHMHAGVVVSETAVIT